MRTVKPTAESLARDRDQGWGNILDKKNKRIATIIWDDSQEQTLDAVFRIIIKDKNGKEVDAVFNKNDFQKLIRWA